MVVAIRPVAGSGSAGIATALALRCLWLAEFES